MKASRKYNFLDFLIQAADANLRNLFGVAAPAKRQNPAAEIACHPLDQQQMRHSAGLMRINHVGEVCAQALYQGQALTARSAKIRKAMQQSAIEENDHLDWCANRLQALDSHISYLNPIWYLASLCIGLSAGLLGDQWSLGFLAETENQVTQHLQSHLEKLPRNDAQSRAIIQQMIIDESQHAKLAMDEGGVALPEIVKKLMQSAAKLMTTTAYWL